MPRPHGSERAAWHSTTRRIRSGDANFHEIFTYFLWIPRPDARDSHAKPPLNSDPVHQHEGKTNDCARTRSRELPPRASAHPACAAKTVIDQVGIDDIGLAVISDFCTTPPPARLPRLCCRPFRPFRKTHEFRQLVERSVGPGLVQSEKVHDEVQVPSVIAADVVVPFEIATVRVITVSKSQ